MANAHKIYIQNSMSREIQYKQSQKHSRFLKIDTYNNGKIIYEISKLFEMCKNAIKRRSTYLNGKQVAFLII